MASIAEQIEQTEAELAKLSEDAKNAIDKIVREREADLAALREQVVGPSKPLFSGARSSGPSMSTTAKSKRNGNGSRKRSARYTPVAPGKRKQQFLEAVRANPGITVAEIGAQFGVDSTGLYRYAKAFEASGEIRKDGKQLYPTEPQVVEPAPTEVPAA